LHRRIKNLLRLLFLVILCSCHFAHAQRFDNRGWIYLSHTNKIVSHFDFFGEAQLRSWDKVEYITATLLRAGINYHLSKKHSIGAGYTYKGDREANEQKGRYDYMNENRAYEQYIFQTKFGKTEWQTRARLEQRFVREDGQRQFSQRGRLQLTAQIPVFANKDFSQGWYTILQNEIFLNIQHKDRVNESLFDQNRLYVSYGYRFNKHIDLELGYYVWTQKEDALEWRNVYQLKVTTGF
jgi:hypothetical protein